ncbi:MAG TPA: hypothetical protein VI504_08275 [Candidatus Eisenbacteria bacterium]
MAGRARATPIGGRLTGQYQHVEQSGRVFYPNGIVRDTSIARSFWSQSYKLHHSATFGQSLNLFSQLDFVDQSYEARPHVSQTATATMRLAHPLFGLSASFRPSVSKVAATSLGNPGDVGTFRPISTHNDQTTFTANFMPPNLPRLDLSWARQRQDAELSDTKRTTTSRNANLVYAVGPLDTHAGIGDQRGDVGTGGARLSDRRHGNAGLGLRLEPLPALTLGMQYDLTAFQTDVPAGPTNHSVSHAGSLSGSLRASQHTGIDLAYSYRTSRQTGGIASRQSSHDGSLLVAYRPNPVASASAGGGFRTLNAERAPVLERYLAGSATAAGRIRTAWTGTASAAHSTLWDRDARARSIESTNLATNLRAGPDFQLGGNFTTSLNSDASVGKGRWSTDGALSVTASPVRKLQLIAGVRSTRAGSSLLGAGTGARSRSIDARWLPAASVDLGGGITQTNPGDRGAGSTTRNARVGLRPGQRLRLSGTYSRSDVATQIAGTSQLRGREVYTAQLGLALARTMSLGANLNLIDPHGANFSRQYDLTLTKDFGR